MLSQRYRQIIKQVVFGNTLLAQEFFIGLPDPQTEISVWLYGLGAPIDVTHRHSMACASPLTMCVAFDENDRLDQKLRAKCALKFCEKDGGKKVLGEIALKSTATISTAGFKVCLFEPRKSANHCLPKFRLGAHYLLHAHSERRMSGISGMKMSFLEKRAAMVNFIRPHPVVLGSLLHRNKGNIFPMNIMGELGNGHFAFALKDSRRAAHLVEATGRIALSNLPMSHAPLAYELAINHTKDCISWDQLPFATRPSKGFSIPVPDFAPRVREMEVCKVHPIGSHTFFVARIVSDETYSTVPVLYVVHGFYQAWRLKDRNEELQASVVENSRSKHGIYSPDRNSISPEGAEKAHGTASS